MKKKLVTVILTFCIFLVSAGPVFAQDPGFELKAEAAILADAATGKILFEKNSHEPLYPASITKIMTLLLTMEAVEAGKVSLEDEVIVSERASSMGGSQIFLSPGDRVTLEELLIGIAVGSGNDASVAAAEHVSGSLEGFVDLMNKRAGELGMKNTHFENSSGLHAEGHVTTAHDVVIMSRELLKHPKVHEWFIIWMDEEFLKDRIKVKKGIYLSNTNRLIKNYSGCDGFKTGFTNEAGHCISATAERDGSRFIAVILKGADSQSRFNEASLLLDYAFANYKTVPVAREDEKIGEAVIQKGKDTTVSLIIPEKIGILVKKGEDPEFEREIIITHTLIAPVAKGEVLGEIIISQKGKEVARGILTAGKDVARATVPDLFKRILDRWFRFGR